MSTTPQKRFGSKSEAGFTLIELLVVILIIGILAAIAIPSFLNQKGKANDASAKELARTAQTTAETYGTEHNGEYTGLTVAELKKLEPTIQTASGSGNAYISGVSEVASTKYKVTATSTSGDTFSITNSGGAVTRSCTGTGGGCGGSSW
jgi:type IV pilus assembly protein PilA